MSVYKPFITSDIITTPFGVNKTYSFQGANEITGSGIDRFIGQNIVPSLWASGSNPTGDITTQDKFLVYRSIRELYYSNYQNGYDDGAPAGTASFNPDGTITGPFYTPNYYNYLTNTFPASRYYPTGSDDLIGVFSIPSNLFGEYIKPGSITLSNASLTLTDDGEGNLLNGSLKVGDVIYQHGMVILTNDGTPGVDGYGFVNYGSAIYGLDDIAFINNFITSNDVTMSFESNITLHEKQFKCTIRENEFNFSQNPTLISGSSNSGIVYDYVTGSYFEPYITTVGLYNNDKELIAVAKLSQPLPASQTTDTSIMVNLDL